jgi:hypothetical protein
MFLFYLQHVPCRGHFKQIVLSIKHVCNRKP